jgi:hypothetical protein
MTEFQSRTVNVDLGISVELEVREGLSDDEVLQHLWKGMGDLLHGDSLQTEVLLSLQKRLSWMEADKFMRGRPPQAMSRDIRATSAGGTLKIQPEEDD